MIQLKVICEECERELKATMYDDRLEIIICEYCEEDARQNEYEDGYAEAEYTFAEDGML